MAHNVELLEEVQGLRDCLAHPNQTAGGSVPDILAEVQASYERGDTLVQDGVEYARCVQSQAAKTRSAPTIGRALKVIAAEAKVKTITRIEQIKTPKYEGPAEITYIALDDHARRSKGAGIRLLLPPRPEKKAQGGSRPRINVPRDETFPTAPIRRKVETWEKFFSTGDERLLDSKLVHQRTDYFTSAGEAISYDEATRFQDEIGLRPAPPPKYRPATQTRFQVEDIDLRSTRFQDEIDSEAADLAT